MRDLQLELDANKQALQSAAEAASSAAKTFLKAYKDSLDKAIADAAKERRRGEFHAGQVVIARKLLSTTAIKAGIDLRAANKEAAEAEQHRAEACAEVSSLREQLGIKTNELNGEYARRRAVEAERDTLWLLVPQPERVRTPQADAARAEAQDLTRNTAGGWGAKASQANSWGPKSSGRGKATVKNEIDI